MAYILIIGTFALGLVCNMEWDKFFQGNASFKEKDFKKAISHYTDAIRMDGNNATYYNNRAMAYLQLCRWFLLHAEISNYFMQVSWVLSYLKEVCTSVAHMRVSFGSFPEAEADCTKALGLDKKVS